MADNCKKILIGMSGGVDSSVAALMLQKGGYEPIGVTLRLHSMCAPGEKSCGSSLDAEDAARVCSTLGMEHYVFGFEHEFENCVINKFIKEYRMGHTPNPCIDCNRFVKFALMEEKGKTLGAEYISTGHYARVIKSGDRFLLARPRDIAKDQTYVLYVLTQNQLTKTVFPLGDLTKEEVREIAAENGFRNANKPDSQDICFVPDGDYAAFIEKRDNKPLSMGNFIDTMGNVMAPHKGAECYTIGQRKGLGIGFGRPVYVVSKNHLTGDVVLGEEKDLYTTRVEVKDINFSAFDRFETSLRCKGKLRYRQREEECIIHPVDKNTVIAEFEKPQRAVTAGQAAVFYDGDIVLGGGTIV
ncbi:MAG: tRNA 2-thiouridine(34) synthase MnmA [Clostridia bacterium]|nr:tRNA 2-thiouridine(34) synthase MnmA [Clostridia bacterium]